MNTLKIKEIFLNLPNKKINLVQKVISEDNSKPKLCLNMTTKDTSCKQVIIPMNNKLVKKFLKDLSMHIININCAFKKILSNTIADFICVDNKGVVIATNNVSTLSNLQEIKKYVKNSMTTNVK